ncbi:MAG: hypothetical protein H0W02_10210 [Ktedonobacteraceae bacterium]|nr:hypothetical protein [Ktedonobacteraceae bacterium]
MSDHLVTLPDAGAVRHDVLDLLALVGHFAAPDSYPPGRLEQELLARFAGEASVAISDIATWLSGAGIAILDQKDLVAQARAGNAAPLHTELQAQNDRGVIQLLAVSSADQLADAASGRPLTDQVAPCFLVRVGYSDADPYGYYYVGLPGLSHTQTRIPWQNVLVAGITDVLSVQPPKPAADLSAATDALHIMEQALATMQAAHATVQAALGIASEQSI